MAIQMRPMEVVALWVLTLDGGNPNEAYGGRYSVLILDGNPNEAYGGRYSVGPNPGWKSK